MIFKIGTDINTALMLTHNRVQDTLSRLPQEVQLQGVQVKKTIPALLLGVHPYSPDGSRSAEYISNYFILHVRDEIARLPGVSDFRILGERQYAMRIWIDPDKAAASDISASDILNVLRARTRKSRPAPSTSRPFQRPSGAYQINVRALGRLTTPEQFGDIIVKSDAQGRVTRIRDIGRVELGSAGLRLHSLRGPVSVRSLLGHRHAGRRCCPGRARSLGQDGGAQEELPAGSRLHQHL